MYYKDKFQCIDEDVEIRGSYNSDITKSLSIQFVACNETVNTCKSYDEIKNFMKRKFILTLENHSRFNLDEYDESKITKESAITWHPMNSILRQESINVVNVDHVNM